MRFDFCANTYSYAIEKCVDLMGSKRVMFGTDMPIAKMRMYRVSENGTYINVVPRGMYGDVSDDPHMRETDEKNVTNFTYEILRAFKKAATNLTLSREDIDNIMWKNATELYGIKF
jgi:predicted TIM-barrel fold metal-dependent hydrolase